MNENSSAAGMEPASGARRRQQRKTPVFAKSDWTAFWLTAGCVFVVYWFSLSPDVDLDKGGIFAAGAAYAGVPHPPGFPLWTVCGWLFTKLLPISNIAWRLAVFSAMCGATASGMVALMVSREGRSLAKTFSHRPAPHELDQLRTISGFAAGCLFGFNGALWGKCVVVDVWPLTILLGSIVICLFLCWLHRPHRSGLLVAAFLVYGLALVNSETMLVLAPAIPFVVALGQRDSGRNLALLCSGIFVVGVLAPPYTYPSLLRPNEFAPASLHLLYRLIGFSLLALVTTLILITRKVTGGWRLTLLGISAFAAVQLLHFYPAVASMTNPPVNWGYPRHYEGWASLLLRAQYEPAHPSDDLGVFVRQLTLYLDTTVQEYGGWEMLLAIAPFALWPRLKRSGRKSLLALLIFFLCATLLLVALLNPEADRQSVTFIKAFFVISYLPLTIWTGCGLVALGCALARPAQVGAAPMANRLANPAPMP